MASSTSSNKSLCFLEAFRERQQGNISEEEYYHYLLGHCTGPLHERDESDGPRIDWELLEVDPFGYAVRCWAQGMDQYVKDVTPFEQVFAAHRTRNVESVKARLNAIDERHAKPLRKLLALRALLDRQPEVLKLCLDMGGFAYESYFEDEANRVKEEVDPETFKVLEGSEFRKLYPRRNKEDLDDDDDEPSGVFDEGGTHPVDW
ncbi:hypothetical protein F5B20DRAFT_559161 [Whalleya microplaca]|nr:hypothetical protein F5B20DRAFT_559161 [Whalleya microplaca]